MGSQLSVASVNWAQMTVCMDVYCNCGGQTHVCTHEASQGSSEYVRCPHCKKVLRLGPEVQLSETRVVHSLSHPRPHASFQWKGTEACLVGRCTCAHEFPIVGAFQYEVDCPACGKHWHVWPYVTGELVFAEALASIAVMQEPEHDPMMDPYKVASTQ